MHKKIKAVEKMNEKEGKAIQSLAKTDKKMDKKMTACAKKKVK